MMTSAEKTAWLAGLKAGDKVVFCTGYYNVSYQVLPVERTTATLIICGALRFSRHTGNLNNGSGHLRGGLEPLTDKSMARIEYAALKSWFSELCHTDSSKPLPVATLRAMKTAFDANTPKETPHAQ